MQKPLLLSFFILLFSTVYAQEDFVILKKKNKTIKNYMSGSYIEFQLNNYQWMGGYIKAIRNDSLLIQMMAVRKLGTIWGNYVEDTSWMNVFPVHINEIIAVPKQSQSAEIFTNGTLLQVGSAGYMALNIINGLSKNEEVFSGNNLRNLGIAAGVFGIGTLLHLTHPSVWKLGKKYRLQYIKLNEAPKS
ncbi:hypothetical protein [Foetidibacter luteolus]|uniref:hypothetical protein n=1 Tax=Foetidibacter luteolus TaxID=2608880 RepID=UPI00129B57E5|nr:hypothetical protein [Foetidibacter luteolus]